MTTWDSRAIAHSGTLTSRLVPLYRRISDDILITIGSRKMQPGEPLPTESEFCATYGVSRITIRKALDELVARHVIERRRGSGTYISSAEQITKAVVLSGYIDDVLMLNRMAVLEDAWRTAARALGKLCQRGCRPRVPTDRRRQPHQGGRASRAHRVLVPPLIATHVSAAEVAGPLPTIRHIERSHGLRVDHANQVLDAVSASAPVAAVLGVRRGAPLLRAVRAYYDANCALIEIFEAQYHPTRYRFSATLLPRHT